MAITPAQANATTNALLGASMGRFPAGYTGDTTLDMVGINLGIPGTYEGDVEGVNLGTPPWMNPDPLIPPPLPPASFSIPRGPTLRGYIPGGRTGLERMGEQWTGLSPEIEARIQQDQRRGLFDVNERSVAQLGPLTGTPKLIVDALKEGELRGDPVDMARGREDYERRQAKEKAARLKIQRLFKFGGRLGIGLGGGLWSGGLSEGKSPYKREYYTDSEGKRQYTGKEEPIYFTDEDSPFREQLPSNVFPREVRGRQAIEGVAERTRQDIGSAWDVAKRFFRNYLPARRPDPYVPDAPIWDPSKEQVPLGTPEELYKQRNDLEEMRLRQIATGIPIGQTFGEGYIPGGEAGLESFFARPPYERQFWRDTGRLPTRAESETGVYDVTPQDPFRLKLGTQYEGMPTPDPSNLHGTLIQAGLSPTVTYTPPPVVPPFGPVEAPEVWRARQESEARAAVEESRTATKEALEELVEPFVKPYTKSGMVESQETPWTPPAPVIPDIVVPPPAAAPAPYVEQFEAFTPEPEPPQIRKVKKPKVKKAKKAKPTRAQEKAKAVKAKKSRKSFESAVAKALKATPTVFRGGPPSVSSVKSKARKKAEAKSFAFEDVKARARGRR
jgi:hypothetical protein